jgi:redox-sensitive bicupin YhaK (pirin superfamily)
MHPQENGTVLAMNDTTLQIAGRVPTQNLHHGDGFRAVGLRGDTAQMDPYLMVDHYWMSQPTFGPHPHAGFSAVTYMFDDAQTGFRNRDSRGNDGVIAPGDVHWTVAGAGVVHDEVPQVPGRTAHGLQLFVNLPLASQHMAPQALHTASANMPRVQQASGALVKVAFGAYDDGHERHASVLPLPTDATLLDVQLQAGQRLRYPVPVGATALLMVVQGQAQVADQTLAAGTAVAMQRSGGWLDVLASLDSPVTQVAVLMGTPLNQTVVRHGPFAMASAADIERAVRDYQAGRMGVLGVLAPP